jgi:hypothetical protein
MLASDGGSRAQGSTNGTSAPVRPAASGKRCPRRIVVLTGEEQSEVACVLAEYPATEVTGNHVHADLQRYAEENSGRLVAVEWLGPLGWMRFLWCRK